MEDKAGEMISIAIKGMDEDLAKQLAAVCISEGSVTLHVDKISKILSSKGIDIMPNDISDACFGKLAVPGHGSGEIFEHLTGLNYYQDTSYYR